MVNPKDRDRVSLRGLAAEATLVLPTVGAGAPLVVGHLLGGRYEIRGVLGRGGMGEVWLARDLKLQVEVALKAVPPEKLGEEGALARLRAEVRSARAVASPHVCRVYDLVEADGLECVSMEYVDGTMLRQVLETRSPLELGEAREIALQLLAGLGAIHEAGLVHRDVKPENVMLTRAGRVVLMDFGIAKAVASGGTVSGTPAYWPPEQAVGAPADPRADVFAAGVVLAEMVAPSGVRGRDERQALWQAVREDPPRVPDTPWSEAISRAVAREPGARYPSAQALARALEEVAHRVTGIEEAQPYPGLAAFTEADAEYFFGREAEVEEVWKRLPHRHLLALVGPSGAGKSSFLRAGLVPAKPEGWAHLVCTPGDAPFVALGQALVPEVSHDTVAMRQMLRFEDADVAVHLFRRWRGDHAEALVIVDQLEELFTLSPPEVQARFASLISRLALEADVHVLLAMRDDFLLHCQEHEALRPVFEGLVPLGPPAGDALRRALVQPALKCGYRFEDEALVAEMLQAVEGERGALPLLAFAAASLWRSRDRGAGLLTRAAHVSIGGVAGALAQHAEATLDRVGADKLPLVRELFRNLVTAQGTRAVRDVDELLTVFPEGRRADAEAVLRTLIEARLLTSYEAHATEPGQTAGRRVELVHESLLSVWPRLVRWRTEDEGGAQLRDQLRQVAHLWEEKGKPADLLWTGTSYQEYQVWRSRYPGGLSDAEEAFGRAMVELAGRRRHRRRVAYAAVLTAVVLTATGLALLLRKSVLETRRAEAETAQREASQLLALGRLRLGDHPNAALAYAIASLERSDNGPARRFAVEALWQGPPALFIPDTPGQVVRWSRDGRWLALGGDGLDLIEWGTNQRRRLKSSWDVPVGFTSDGRRLVSGSSGKFEVWALPEGRLERTLEHSPATGSTDLVDNDRLLTFWSDTSAPPAERPRLIRRLSLDGTPEQSLGRWEPHGTTGFGIDPSGTWIFSVQRGRLLQQRLDALSAPPRVLGVREGDADVWVKPWRDRLVTRNSRGEVHIWDVPSARIERTLKSPADSSFISLDPRGRFLATSPYEAMAPRSMFLFDLAAPPTAEPVGLLDSDATWLNDMNFSPDGSWLASEHTGTVVLWNTARARSLVVGRQKPPNMTVAFTRDGRLLSASDEGVLRSWPLDPAAGADMHVLWSRPGAVIGVARVLELDPGGRSVILTDATGWQTGKVLVVPLNGSAPSIHQLKHPEGRGAFSQGGMLDAGGRFLAMAIAEMGHSETNAIRILDLVTGDERTLDTHPKSGEGCEPTGSDYAGFAVPLWLRDGRLVSDGDAGLRVWDLATGTSKRLRPCKKMLTNISLLASPDSRLVLRLDGAVQTGYDSSLSVFDLASRVTREITSHGKSVLSFALDPSGTILVTGDKSGVVRVGRLTGGEPHLLFGHTGPVTSVAVSPDGRWIASGSDDGTIRRWPMPNMTKPPLHMLPYDKLMAKLKSLTNLRAVRDAASDSGWKIGIGPFPGWKDAPIW
jgi:WD40 repeat protein